MNLIRFSPNWSLKLAKKILAISKREPREIPAIEWIPTQEISDQDPLRMKDLDELITKIVLSGRSQRKSVSCEEEVQDAA
jgi:hypothetical protein